MIGRRGARVALAAVSALVAAPGVLAAVHLTTLTAASLLPPPAAPRDGRRRRLLVVVAARDEAAVIARAVTPLVAQRRPGDLVLVVADRCRDHTAALAAGAGAEVLVRPPGAPPGKAAAIVDGLAAMGEREWDALVTVDADSVVGDGFLDACDAVLQTGALAAQARSEALPGPGPLSHAAVVAAAVQGITLPRGRHRLGIAVRLKGPGMVVRRDVLARHPFPSGGSSEDTRYGIDLVLAGVVPVHCDAARVRSQSSRRLAAASDQRLRWEAGRLHLARSCLASLLRARTPSAVEAAIHLATPPVAVAVGLLAAGGAVAAAAGATPLVVVEAALLALVGLDVAAALVVAGADRRTWAALALAPAYVAWKGVLQARALVGADLAARPFERAVRD